MTKAISLFIFLLLSTFWVHARQSGVTGTVSMTAVVIGNAATITVTDCDEDVNTAQIESILVSVENTTTHEIEVITLTETGPSTCIFAGTINVVPGTGPGSTTDGGITVKPGEIVRVTYADKKNASGNAVNTTAQRPAICPAIPLPAPSSEKAVLCEGELLQLLANVSADSYSWTGPNGFSSNERDPVVNHVTTDDAGSYRLKITVNGCASGFSSPTSVQVNIKPIITASDLLVTCVVNPAPLIINALVEGGTSPFEWNWTGPNGYTSIDEDAIIANAGPQQSGSYTAHVTDAKGCAATPVSVQVTITNGVAAPSIEPAGPLCEGEVLELNTNPYEGNNVMYIWTLPNGGKDTTDVPTLIIPSVTVANHHGTYKVFVKKGDCASTAAETFVIVREIPMPTASAVYSTAPDNLCAGQSLLLSAGISNLAFTYAWTGPNGFTSAIPSPVIFNATPAANGSYLVNVSNGQCKTASAVQFTNIKPVPATPVFIPIADVCEGSPIELNITEAYKGKVVVYSWTLPNLTVVTTQEPSLIISSTSIANHHGKFKLTVSVDGCTSSSSETNVVVKAVPVISPSVAYSTAPNFCEGASLQFSSGVSNDGEGFVYSWSGPNGFSSTEKNPVLDHATPATNGSYNLMVTNAICKATSIIQVVGIKPIPTTPSITSTGNICEGNDFELNTQSYNGKTVVYTWTLPSGAQKTTATPTLVIQKAVAATDSGVYGIKVAVDGCEAIGGVSNVLVIVKPASPMPVASYTDANFCAGDSLLLSTQVTGEGFVYAWTGPNGFTSAAQNPIIAKATPANNGSYLLTISHNGCSSTGTTSVFNIKPIPVPPVITLGASTVCEGGRLTMNALPYSGTNVQYIWTTPTETVTTSVASLTLNNISASQAGTYSLTVMVNGCASLPAASSTLAVITPPSPISISVETAGCEGNDIVLKANAVADKYRWAGPKGFASAQQTATIKNTTTLSAGTYTLFVSNGGCPEVSTSVSVEIKPKPAQPIILSSASAVCENTTLRLSTNVKADSYTWIMPGGNTIVTADSFLIVSPVALSNAGNYSLNVTKNGCTSTNAANIAVVVDEKPTEKAFAGEDFIACPNSEPFHLIAENMNGIWSTSSDAQIVSPNDPHSLITNLKPGRSYQFIWAMTAGACGIVGRDTVVATVPNATSTLTALLDTATVGFNEASTLNVLANDQLNGYEVNISIFKEPIHGDASINGDNTVTYSPSLEFVGNDEFVYEVCMEACPHVCDTALVMLEVKYTFVVPDVITPGGDGKNDNFEIKGIEKYPLNELYIYNRWGNEIFSTLDYKNDWFGTYKGQPAPVGTYYYVLLNRSNGKKLSHGYLTINR